MAPKISANQGGQAAAGNINTNITNLIGQLSGSGTIVIHNLHINTHAQAAANSQMIGGLIAYYDLAEWWLGALGSDERGTIEDAFGPCVTSETITSTSQSAGAWLRGMARHISPVHPYLASKIRAKAQGIETGLEVDNYWQRQFDAVRGLWQRAEFELAREELRAISYRQREESALPEHRAMFAELLAYFTRSDPYYANVMEVALPIIATRPGVIQSTLAKSLSWCDIERFRHAMYYGEVIGEIRRVKSGRSYGLFII